MIITCPNCKKQFKTDPSLIPKKGRELQCGSCQNIWFYKIDDENVAPLTLNENISKKEDISDLTHPQVKKQISNKKFSSTKKPTKKGNSISKFFSYLIVLIISLVALIILIDTFKTPLINIFPKIEILLFNLFETLKDIKLFIIDLS